MKRNAYDDAYDIEVDRELYGHLKKAHDGFGARVGNAGNEKQVARYAKQLLEAAAVRDDYLRSVGIDPGEEYPETAIPRTFKILDVTMKSKLHGAAYAFANQATSPILPVSARVWSALVLEYYRSLGRKPHSPWALVAEKIPGVFGEIDEHIDLDEMVDGYIDAAMWVGVEFGEDATGLDDDCSTEARAHVALFAMYALRPIIDTLPHAQNGEASIGHDLFLTENGHGAGFWDRDYPRGGELEDMARYVGESYFDMDEDGQVYCHFDFPGPFTSGTAWADYVSTIRSESNPELKRKLMR